LAQPFLHVIIETEHCLPLGRPRKVESAGTIDLLNPAYGLVDVDARVPIELAKAFLRMHQAYKSAL
jgi:hypothetical protein